MNLSTNADVVSAMNISGVLSRKSANYRMNVRTLTRELVDLLIQHIYIYSDTSVEIVWKFEDEYKRLLAEMEQKGVDERV